ncbi:DUF58 domain-containing protein [Cellulomonas composti]|uniref:DUF58 domain-containing protein n=1 Tax=Cellulomonas composti TaxID=266130 RepID=A0A511JDG3_9CELL|nr:DUF58 domain-containing protein [Cellulomonas composti]GEL96040.1 hypothetical protein CCO02nite_26980 [Cellulomonas composti]
MTSWARTRLAAVGAVVGALLLVVGALGGRPDVAVLGVAPLVAALWDWTRRPSGDVAVRLRPDADQRPEPGTIRSALEVTAPAGTAAVVLAARRSGRSSPDVVVRVAGSRLLPVVVHTVRTGPQEVAQVEALGVGPGFASVSTEVPEATAHALVLPAPVRLDELPLPPRLRGLSGGHESRRPGEGGGLRDVHPYATGDRLRRIDWRVTARRSPDLAELYVRREHALAEAAVMLVVDSRDDVGPDPTTWRGSLQPLASDATSLDLARQAATSAAQGFLALGDRVGLDDLGAWRRPLPPGGGRRQLDRIRTALALSRPEGEPTTRVRAPQLPSGALVMVFSTFLDDVAVRAAIEWRRTGHRVVAVDVLPPVRTRHLLAREVLALRVVRMEREDRLATLAESDVDLVTWRDSPQVALTALARRARRRPGAGVPAR